MKKIRVENLKDLKKELTKVFMDWGQHPDGVEVVFAINYRRSPAAAPSNEAITSNSEMEDTIVW